LKHHEEVETLRRLYGSAFIAVGVYTPYKQRHEAVCKRLQVSAGHGNPDDYRHEADRLIEKDRDEENKPFGQHVSDAFALADVVVSTAAGEVSSVERFIRLLFGDWTKTPTRDEVGMTYALVAAYQSSSMARQVGAAICRADGSVVATGTNDVPKFGGGIFDANDLGDKKPDVRDFSAFGYDTSDNQRRELLEDILRRLIKMQVVTSMSEDDAPIAAELMLRERASLMRQATFMGTIDYIRAMHAEAAAFSNAARHGIPVSGCTLYVTTFPCHDCAKQIIADGIHRVVYIEPYTKSLAQTFYDLQIDVHGSNLAQDTVKFHPFVGVAPRRYRELFAMTGNRKDGTGRYLEWNKDAAIPRLPESLAGSSARSAGEKAELGAFDEEVARMGLMPL
jgi:cytidine deaminase